MLGINSVIGWQYLLSVKREKEFIFSVSIGAISNIFFNNVLISNLKSRGAVIASLISMTIMSIINFIIIRKQISFKHLILRIYKPLIASTFMLVIVYLVSRYLSSSFISTLIQVIIGIIMYVLILLIIKDSILIDYINSLKKKK